MVVALSEGDGAPTHGFVGRIPVRNLWLLMLYASELYKSSGIGKSSIEENPEDIPDLIGEILAEAVERRQRRQLSLGYREREAILTRMRGRIDVFATERRQLLSRGRIACRFSELTIDTPRNRFVRAALELVGRIAQRREVSHRCRKLASDMKAMGVTGVLPTKVQMLSDRFGRHDADDRFMVEAAKLAFELALPTESAGGVPLPLPGREEHWARRLFERAVGGFYRHVLAPDGWDVRTGAVLSWPIEWKTRGLDEVFPAMHTDIVLNHPPSGHRIVIDTKFTGLVTSGWHRSETLRSGYLYQVYAYLRSQVGQGDSAADRACGVLLHPSVGTCVNEAALIQGHLIRFMTVDLSADVSTIHADLLRVARDAESNGAA